MNIDFSLVLVILSALTGLAWAFDKVVLAPPRKEAIVDFLKGKGLTPEEFNSWVDTLDEDGSPLPAKGKTQSPGPDPTSNAGYVPSGSKGGRSPSARTRTGAFGNPTTPTTFGAASFVIDGGRCGGAAL